MTLSISKSLRTDNIVDNQKHGDIYPELRSAPVSGKELGNANDQNLNKIFGSEEDSFFNTKVNSTASVALSYFSGLQHYDKNVANDLIALTDVSALTSKLDNDISVINSDVSLTDEEKAIQISLINDQLNKILLSVNDANEQLTEIDSGTGDTIEGEDNFNPDFGAASIRWRYSESGELPLNRSNDGINNRGYPNIAFPMKAIDSDLGIVDLEAASDAPAIVPTINNYHSGDDAALPKNNADIRRIMNRYLP